MRVQAMRFRVRPRVNVELPLQIGVQMSVVDRHIEIRADVMIPGYFSTSRRASQVACENIQIRFPIPETLVYMFRVEKRFRYGSVHSSRKKPGRIKGLERLTMFATGGSGGGGVGGGSAANAVPGSTPIVLQASSGLAKYEHLHRAVVWRISRLPERNQGRYGSSLLKLCRSNLFLSTFVRIYTWLIWSQLKKVAHRIREQNLDFPIVFSPCRTSIRSAVFAHLSRVIDRMTD